MKKLLRSWARRFFEKQIRVYASSAMISGVDMMITRQPEKLRDHTRFKLVHDMAEGMLLDGLIEFEEFDDYTKNRVMCAKIRVI